MRQRSPEDPSSFPHWVALASLVFALALFFTNTVPALREQQSLADVDAELIDLRRRYEQAIRLAHLGAGGRHDYDLQSLLVAIDQLGYTPLELCAAFPDRQDQAAAEQGQRGPDGTGTPNGREPR